MRRRPLAPRRWALLACLRPLGCALLGALGLAACGASVSTAAFKGEAHAVAQTVANLQSHATAGEESKICAQDLAHAVVARLGGGAGCERAIKSQLDDVDNLEASVQSVTLGRGKAAGTASAQVKSIHSGKSRLSTVALVREGGKWKISGLG